MDGNDGLYGETRARSHESTEADHAAVPFPDHRSGRIRELDAVRGVALLGILLVNIFVFNVPHAYFGEFYGGFSGVERLVVEGVAGFCGGKFLFVFSFLFGYGIVLFERGRQGSFARAFLRRMIVLGAIGCVHLVTLWFGDILHVYAFAGLVVIPIVRLRIRTLTVAAVACFLVPASYYVGWAALGWPEPSVRPTVPLSVALESLANANVIDRIALRITAYGAFLPENAVWYVPKALGTILLGVVAGRVELVCKLRSPWRTVAVRSSWMLLAATSVWIFARPSLFAMFDLEAQPGWRPFLILVNSVFDVAMGAAYVLLLLLASHRFQRFGRPFERAGRLALTNYVLQSVLATVVFSSLGLGLQGLKSPSALVLIALTIFGVNLGFSALWLRRRRVGPLERVWRWASRT
ncbi:MAG: DUF418 domain-containing protein [Myxococcota bacterium]